MLKGQKIKVLVVDDSLVFRKYLIENLPKVQPRIEIVGYATDPYDAFDKLEYQIYEVKTSCLYDDFLKLITGETAIEDSENWRDVNRGRWEADVVYQYRFKPGTGRLYEELYVICQGNRIVRLGVDWETTEEELSIAFNQLGIERTH